MRHFNSVCKPSIETYDINGGEYAASVNSVLRDAVIKFAAVLEVSPKLIKEACAYYFTDGGLPANQQLTPSEASAVEKFAVFVEGLVRQERSDWKYGARYSATFIHANLNTGEVFTWIHMVA